MGSPDIVMRIKLAEFILRELQGFVTELVGLAKLVSSEKIMVAASGS